MVQLQEIEGRFFDILEVLSTQLSEFKKVTIVICHEAIQLPEHLEGEKIAHEVLSPLPNSLYTNKKLIDQPIQTHYFLDPDMKRMTSQLGSQSTSFIHLSNLLSDYLYRTSQTKMLVFTSGRKVHITLANKEGLQFYNAYDFNSPEDYLYWIMAVTGMQGIDIKTTPVKLAGRIGKEGPIADLLQNYIPDLEYVPLNHLKTDLEVEKHMFLDLYLANLCG